MPFKMRSLTYARGNPYLLMAVLSMVGSAIFFLFLVLIFIQRISQEHGTAIVIPISFFYSTIALVLSSGSLIFANQRLKAEKYRSGYFFLVVTLSLAVSFAMLQVAGWNRIFQTEINLHKTHLIFLLLFSGLHFLHILLGILGLMVITYHAHQNKDYVDGFIQALNPAKKTWLQMVSWFWHFLDVLWLLLFFLIWFFKVV